MGRLLRLKRREAKPGMKRERMTLHHFCSVLVGNMMILANMAAAPASVYKDRYFQEQHPVTSIKHIVSRFIAMTAGYLHIKYNQCIRCTHNNRQCFCNHAWVQEWWKLHPWEWYFPQTEPSFANLCYCLQCVSSIHKTWPTHTSVISLLFHHISERSLPVLGQLTNTGRLRPSFPGSLNDPGVNTSWRGSV